MKEPPAIKAMTRREIAQLLGIEEHTLKRKLDQKGIALPKGIVPPQCQKVIFDALWYPSIYTKGDFDSL
jgi:DNA invertase Pin-like site-specific DNA recombinase